MTDEAQGQNHDDTPTPPASTRWTEDPVQEDDGLAPPYVPGRPAGSTAGAPAPDRASVPTAEAESATPMQTTEPAEPTQPTTETGDEPFPFEAPFGAGDEADAAPEDDFPFDQFNIEGEGAHPAEAEAEGETETEVESGSGWSPVADVEWEPAGERMDAVEQEAEPEEIPEAELVPLDTPSEPVDVEPELEAEPVGTAAGEVAAEVGDEAEEVARLLDRLAGLLRDEGAEAVRREMDSSDRLTALLSGLVAGYLSGRS